MSKRKVRLKFRQCFSGAGRDWFKFKLCQAREGDDMIPFT